MFQELANELLDTTDPAGYNQAIMDFGANCCTPKNPTCTICPLRLTCFARKNNLIAEYPPRKKTIAKKIRHFHFFILIDSNRNVRIRRRTTKDIWNSLYEFPMLESLSSRKPGKAALKKLFLRPLHLGQPVLIQAQTLSHRIIHGYFYVIKANRLLIDSVPVPILKLQDYALPGIIAKNLERLKASV